VRNPFAHPRAGWDPLQQLQQVLLRRRGGDDDAHRPDPAARMQDQSSSHGSSGPDQSWGEHSREQGDARAWRGEPPRGGHGGGYDGGGGGASTPSVVDRWRETLHERRYEYVQDPDDVKLDLREHVVTLAQPLLRTICGAVALVAPHPAAPVIIFALIVAVLVRRRRRLDLGQTVIVAVVAGLGIAYAGSRQTSVTVHVVLLVVLLLWLVLDIYVWYDDRLIVTGRRIYRVYGMVTKHGPSMALSSVAYIDVELPPLGQAFNYGTLVLDSAAQRDDPLSHFAYLPDAVQVHKQILALRAAALRTLPRPQDMI